MESYALFFSPHPDDVVWSTYSSLVGFRGGKIVVTLFNRSKRFGWGLKASVPLATFWRTLEDDVALTLLGARPVHLYLSDTSVRGRTRFELPFWVKPRGRPPETLFSPLGVGGHLDHLYTRRVALETWFRLRGATRLVFYEDLPYAGWMTTVEEREREILGELARVCGGLVVKHVPLTQTQMLRKILMCSLYVSQDPPIRVLLRRGRQLGRLIGYDYAERIIAVGDV